MSHGGMPGSSPSQCYSGAAEVSLVASANIDLAIDGYVVTSKDEGGEVAKCTVMASGGH
jgi:hypothetical protein